MSQVDSPDSNSEDTSPSPIALYQLNREMVGVDQKWASSYLSKPQSKNSPLITSVRVSTTYGSYSLHSVSCRAEASVKRGSDEYPEYRSLRLLGIEYTIRIWSQTRQHWRIGIVSDRWSQSYYNWMSRTAISAV